jgi:sulfane dehydrogenase subunit SoxC
MKEKSMDSKKASRRKFLKRGAAGAAAAAASAIPGVAGQAPGMQKRSLKDEVAYGERSPYVKSVRISVTGRPSPDEFGLTFHVLTPLQDSVGMITPSALHFVGTHRGAIVPDIKPEDYRFLLHGMVDRPLEFTLDELKRFPSVSRPHFLECLGNRANANNKTVQETTGLTSCAEWTGVPLSTLLKECGVQKGAAWVVAEGSEEVKGAGSFELAKAMDDCIVAYGQNGEALRPQNGYPVRLIVPGFEGIYNTKWLRRMKVTDKYYMTYNDYGHINNDPKVAALTFQWGPKSVITSPSGGMKLSGPGFYQITGLAWSGGGAVKKVEISTDGGKTWKDAEIRSQTYKMAHTRFGLNWKWDGKECVIMSRCIDELGQVQPSREQAAVFFGHPKDYYHDHGVQGSDNTIVPWKVAGDGSVTNGLA